MSNPGGRKEEGPRPDAARATAAWSVPEIRVVKDDQGRLRIDQDDPATYGAYTARQFLATAAADPRYREGMTKRPSTSSIRITYLDFAGRKQEAAVREIFCRMEGDALVLTHFDTPGGEKVKDLPIPVPEPEELADADLDDMDRLSTLAMAEFGDEEPSEVEPEPEPEPEPQPGRPMPEKGRRLPSGPLRQYGEPTEPAAAPASAPAAPRAPSAPTPPPRPAAAVSPSAPGPAKPAAPAGLAVRALDENEATSLRGLIEGKAGQARWASGLLIQAAERCPGDRKQQNEYLASLLRVSLDPARAESGTPLAATLRGVIEEVFAYKAGVLDRDPLRAEKLALLPFARSVLDTGPVEDDQPKTVSGMARRTPAQVLARLEDPKLARATRVKLLLETVPELIEGWKPDKESGRSEAGNENSPAIVRRLFTVANEQRQQRKYIDDGVAFRKANERYAGLQGKLPKASAGDDA